MIDRCGRNIDYLRISVTDRCNLRCIYCMPEEGIRLTEREKILQEPEIIRVCKVMAELGITKIKITGGEPLVRSRIPELIYQIKEISGIEKVTLTTNGILLKGQMKALAESGLDSLNISLDTLDHDKFRYITRLGELNDVFEGIEAAFEAGFEKIKINTVLMGGFNDDEIENFVALTKDRPIEVRFIELMPIGGGLDFEKAQFISCQEVLQRVPELESMEMSDGVASMYRLPGAAGRVGLIRPISCEFCSGCNKIRLTADGMLKPCLHLDAEISIKGHTQEEMKAVMKQAILDKPQKRDTMDADNPSQAGRNMNRIGG